MLRHAHHAATAPKASSNLHAAPGSQLLRGKVDARRSTTATTQHQQRSSTAASSSSSSSSDAGAAPYRRLMFLPDGRWFMATTSSGDDGDEPILGDSWVMRSGGALAATAWGATIPGLVPLRPQATGVVPFGAAAEDGSSYSADGARVVVLPVVAARARGGRAVAALPETTCTGIVPFKAMLDDCGPPPPELPELDGRTCTAIVPVAVGCDADSLDEDDDAVDALLGGRLRRRWQQQPGGQGLGAVYETFNDASKNPRRTAKIRFSCKRCGATTIKPVNPHAWATGTVFAKCGGCQVTHKLIDNLKLFHELNGPVFNEAPPPPGADKGDATPGACDNGLPDVGGGAPPLRLRLPSELPWPPHNNLN